MQRLVHHSSKSSNHPNQEMQRKSNNRESSKRENNSLNNVDSVSSAEFIEKDYFGFIDEMKKDLKNDKNKRDIILSIYNKCNKRLDESIKKMSVVSDKQHLKNKLSLDWFQSTMNNILSNERGLEVEHQEASSYADGSAMDINVHRDYNQTSFAVNPSEHVAKYNNMENKTTLFDDDHENLNLDGLSIEMQDISHASNTKDAQAFSETSNEELVADLDYSFAKSDEYFRHYAWKDTCKAWMKGGYFQPAVSDNLQSISTNNALDLVDDPPSIN